jgi:hypothetical protein
MGLSNYASKGVTPDKIALSLQEIKQAKHSSSNDRLLILAREYFKLASHEYKLHVSFTQILQSLTSCGVNYLRFYASETLPLKRDILWVYHEALPCLLCFGDENAMEQFAALEEWRYNWPPVDPGPQEWYSSTPNFQVPIRAYIREILRLLVEGHIDQANCESLNSHLQDLGKSALAKEISLGLLTLQAIDNRQGEEVCHHILSLVQAHRQRVERGQIEQEGSLPMQALMLARLAALRGIVINLNDPVFLLLGDESSEKLP